MGTELKDRIEKEIEKRNFTPKGVMQTIKNSLNGIKCYAEDGKSITCNNKYDRRSLIECD